MNEKILIIDDDVDTLKLVGLMLQKQSYQIVAAGNGLQGLEQAENENPDLILLDVMMPGMDGYEVAKRLRANPLTANTPILMFTAKTQLDDKVTGFEAGADDYLTKPTHPSELNAHVKALLSRNFKGKVVTSPLPTEKRALTIGILSPRGGQGVSTVAVNLGGALHIVSKQDVIVGELRPGMGSLGPDLGEPQPRALAELLTGNTVDMTRQNVKEKLFLHGTGLRLLFGTLHPKDAALANALVPMETLVNRLSYLAPYLVLDLGAGLTTLTQKLINSCNLLLVVAEPVPNALDHSKMLIDDLLEIGVPKGNIQVVVVNRIRSDTQLTLSQIENQLGMPPLVAITPTPELIYLATRMKTIAIVARPDSLTAQQFTKLAAAVLDFEKKEMTSNKKRLDGYRRLIDIARDLASTLDLDILLNRIVCAASELTEAEAASILLYDDAARQLFFQVATNLDQPTMRGLAVPLEGSVAGWVVTNRKAARIPDVKLDPRHFNNIEKQTHIKTCSLVAVPLITKDKVVGVLEVINKQVGDFTEDDEDMLQVLGAQAAVAIENARLFHQSDLIAEFVHELRTPLASIGTATYLLLRPEMSQEQRQSMIQNIHGETLRLNMLASSFLDLARLESGRVQFNLTCFDLGSVLRESSEIMQTKADECAVTMEIVIPPDFPQVKADRDKIKQVVLNLLSNAIKYNCPNGTVTMAVSTDGREWRLAVTDTGNGIPLKAVPHLFEKFYRVEASQGKVAGTGLGLSICKQIVAGHGGSIEVRSKYGQGATFTIHIPIN